MGCQGGSAPASLTLLTPCDAAVRPKPKTHSPQPTPPTRYYRTDGSPRMSDLGYKESERDRALRLFTWDATQRLSSGLAVRGR